MQADGIETPVEILLCPFSSTIVDAPLYRPVIEPKEGNGLVTVSQLMADKVGPVPHARIGSVIGKLDAEDLYRLDLSLATILDLGS